MLGCLASGGSAMAGLWWTAGANIGFVRMFSGVAAHDRLIVWLCKSCVLTLELLGLICSLVRWYSLLPLRTVYVRGSLSGRSCLTTVSQPFSHSLLILLHMLTGSPRSNGLLS